MEELTVDVDAVALRQVIGRAGSGPLVLLAHSTIHLPWQIWIPSKPIARSRCPAPMTAQVVRRSCWNWRARLTKSTLPHEVWLAILDGQHPLAGGEPVSAGAKHPLAESLPSDPLPEAVVLLDFVGATDQRFRYRLQF